MAKVEIQTTANVVHEVHVDFDLQINPSLEFIIENLEGVEKVFFNDKYEFVVFTGRCFDAEIIKQEIISKIEDFKQE